MASVPSTSVSWNAKKYETLTDLPVLGNADIAKQIEYMMKNKWTPCLEVMMSQGTVDNRGKTTFIVGTRPTPGVPLPTLLSLRDSVDLDRRVQMRSLEMYERANYDYRYKSMYHVPLFE